MAFSSQYSIDFSYFAGCKVFSAGKFVDTTRSFDMILHINKLLQKIAFGQILARFYMQLGQIRRLLRGSPVERYKVLRWRERFQRFASLYCINFCMFTERDSCWWTQLTLLPLLSSLWLWWSDMNWPISGLETWLVGYYICQYFRSSKQEVYFYDGAINSAVFCFCRFCGL